MSKKIILLTVLGLMLAVTGSASAVFSLKVDLCFNYGTSEVPIPDPATWKGSEPGFEDWMPWPAYADSEAHDARNVWDVGGSGIHIGIASATRGSFQVFLQSLGGEDKICNSWIVSTQTGNPEANTHLVMWANEGLVPGPYAVYGYHNNPDGSEPNMVKADARTYCADNVIALYPARTSGAIDNIGKSSDEYGATAIGDTSQYPCDSVISDINDYNIPIQHEANDVNLVPSVVAFTTDGNSPVWVMYHSGAGSHSLLNAFILKVSAVYKQTSGSNPQSGAENVCPDTKLTWINGGLAVENDVYLGTDFNDVNDANTSVTLGVWKVTQEANEYTTSGLELGTTYYWRVDAVNDANGESPWKGRIWSFTTENGQAFDPSPTDSQFSVLKFPFLYWSPSCMANTHDVYFGTDLDDVNDANTSNPLGVFKINQAATSYFASGASQNATQYYWRIDERTDTETIKGNLWKFFTYGGTLFHYTFDGVMDANVYDPCDGNYMVPDSTGNVAFNITRTADPPPDRNSHVLTYGESNPLINPLETSAHFDCGIYQGQTQRVGLYRGAGTNQGERKIQGLDITDLITPEYTIEMWIKLESFFEDNMGLFRKWDRSYGLTMTNDSYLHFWQAGEDNLISSDANNPIKLNTWTHVAATFDYEDPCEPLKLYIDGDLVASGGPNTINPDNDDDPVTIGCKVNPLRTGDYERMTDAIDGFIDELRVSDVALLPPDFLLRGDLALAWMPRPKNGEQEVKNDVILDWRPGDWADSHDVYFGTDYDDVNDANTNTPVICKAIKGPNEYTPGQLDLETTYYWRIDEVDDSNEFRWKGNTWSFTIANYVVIDDFESYDTVVNRLWDVWDFNATGSYYTTEGIISLHPVHGGVMSMQYIYDNADMFATSYYSELIRTFDSPQNWVSAGVTMLTLYFYGDPDNDADISELMYVGLRDGSDASAKVSYDGDMNDIKVEDWQEWNILLSAFTDVNMAEVNDIAIGFGEKGAQSPGGNGTVFFDDIRIYPPKCVLEFGPTADISGDCIVNYLDIAIMGEEWLKSDNLLAVSAPTTGPVGHWEMDEGIDADVADSSGNEYDGTAQGDYSWVAGRIGSSAIEFTGGKVLVPDNGNTPLLNIASEVSVTAWVKFSRPPDDYTSRVVVKGLVSNDSENYALNVGSSGKCGFSVRDSNNKSHDISSGDKYLPRDEWVHIAGVFDGNGIFDGNDIKVYVNGDLANSKLDANSIILLQDSNEALAIGDAVETGENRAFPGAIDDARVYNYGLTNAEVAYIATEGTGYVPLVSIADLYKSEPAGQKAVNFKDYAELMKQWLDKQYWPTL